MLAFDLYRCSDVGYINMYNCYIFLIGLSPLDLVFLISHSVSFMGEFTPSIFKVIIGRKGLIVAYLFIVFWLFCRVFVPHLYFCLFCDLMIFCSFMSILQRRQWQPTPVLLPGGSYGWGSLVGCHLWGRTESDTTEAT